eukprot:GSChrysophyteH1.ASY1.ANO1.1401.1 assembled CDS
MKTDSLIGEVNDSGSLVTITMNRPKALNALDGDMCKGMLDILGQWESSTTKPVAFVLKGAGEKAFCAGGDVKSIWDEIANGGHKHSDFFRTEYQMNYALGTSSVPQISLWNGFVMGGGVGISALGKYRVATDTTVFSMPETAIGLFPDVGSSSWLPALAPPGVGMYIGLTGDRMFAADLLSSGIATHYVPKENMEDLEKSLSNAKDAAAVQSVLDEFSGTPDTNKSVIIPHGEAITRCFATKTGLQSIYDNLNAEIAAENAHSAWAAKTLKTLMKMSPTSCAVTYEQLERGVGKDLKECLIMEYRVSQRCMAADFQEGIRALLVDRDNNPTWAPAPSMAEVDAFFAPLPEEGDLSL